MKTDDVASEIRGLADDDLNDLASTWRTHALRGDREANGVAHLLEVEQRKRRNLEQPSLGPTETEPFRRPWWKFWSDLPTQEAGAPNAQVR